MSDEGSDSWEVVEETSSDEEEDPEYADARLSGDVEAFLASAAAFKQGSTAFSTAKTDLIQAATDMVEKMSKFEAITKEDKLRRYKTMKRLIRQLKSIIFLSNEPSFLEENFVKIIQVETSVNDMSGPDFWHRLRLHLQSFQLVTARIAASLAVSQHVSTPQSGTPQISAQDNDHLGATSPLDTHQGKDDVPPQGTSLSTTDCSVATPAEEDDSFLVKTASQEAASQKTTAQFDTPEDAIPQELVHQEATPGSYPGLEQSESPACTWNLRDTPWDSESIWTFDSSSSSCDSHSDVDGFQPSSSSSSSSYQVLSDSTDEDALEEPSPEIVMWFSRSQPEPSGSENPADGPSVPQVMRLNAKLMSTVPHSLPSVTDKADLEEFFQEPSVTETAASDGSGAPRSPNDFPPETFECEEVGRAAKQELEEGETDAKSWEDEPMGDHVPEDLEDQEQQEAEARVWNVAAFFQLCSSYCDWLVDLFFKMFILPPAQARGQYRMMRLALLLSLAILAVLMLSVSEVSRQAFQHKEKSLQAYQEENRLLQAEVQMLNETIHALQFQHEMEIERCKSAKTKPDGVWDAVEQFSNFWGKNAGWSILDSISVPLKKVSTHVHKRVSRTLEDIPKMYDDFVKNTLKVSDSNVDEPKTPIDDDLMKKLEKHLKSIWYTFDTILSAPEPADLFLGRDLKESHSPDKSGESMPFQSVLGQNEPKKSRGGDEATLHKHGKPQPVPEEEDQSKRGEMDQSMPSSAGQKGSREVRFHAKTGRHKADGARRKGGEGRRHPGMKYILKLKKLGKKACLDMKPKEVKKVIKRLELRKKNVDEAHTDSFFAEVDCQMQWWGAGKHPGMHHVPVHCQTRMAEWQFKLQDHELICGQGKKADKKQDKKQNGKQGKKHGNGQKLKSQVLHMEDEGFGCGDKCKEMDSASEGQEGHQYRASYNHGARQAKTRGTEQSGEGVGGSHQQRKRRSTDTGSHEADAEGKWYEEMMEHRQREHQRQVNDKDDWYILRAKARRKEREETNLSDWFFDRHRRRKWWRNCKSKFWNWVYGNTFAYFP